MELRHLRYFVAVAESGSFTRASQALFVAQPPLSTQIRDLEAELGTALLVRHVRGVTLTPAGDAFLRDARDLLAQAERMKRNAAQRAGRAGRALRIGFIASASAFVLPHVLPKLSERYPDVAVDVREMLSIEQIAALQTGSLDAAICRPPVRAKMLTTLAEFPDPFCLAIPRSHSLAKRGSIRLQAAADADFVSFKRDQARAFFDQTLNFCNESGFSPKIRCEAGTVFGVINLVAAGVGVAIMPVSAASVASQRVVMRRLVHPARPGFIVLVARRVDRDPAVAFLSELVKDAFARLHGLVTAKLGE